MITCHQNHSNDASHRHEMINVRRKPVTCKFQESAATRMMMMMMMMMT